MGSRWVWVCACVALAMIGCSDTAKMEDCPDGAVCTDGGGAFAGDGSGSGATGGGTGATGGGTGATGGDGDGDGVTDGGMMDSGPLPGADIPMDGSQGAYCEGDNDCEGGRGCYQDTHICSEPCTLGGGECDALGGGYGCYNAAGQAYCRIECTGEDDTSCPDMQRCLVVDGGGFRCGIDPADVSGGDANGGDPDNQWQSCQETADCGGDLICYRNWCTYTCSMFSPNCDDPGDPYPPASCLPRTDGPPGSICAIMCSDGDTCPGDTRCLNLPGFPIAQKYCLVPQN